jgi:DNA-binding transcriptional LysR family regulator
MSPQDLLGQRLIMPSHVDPPILRQLRLATRNHPVAEGGIEFVANTDTAMLRVDLGMGMTLIPERIMSTSFDSSRVRFCELAGLETEFEMVAIYRKDNQQQTLLNFLKSIRR